MLNTHHDPMSDDEDGMVVALGNANNPRGEDPICLALEARGLVRKSGASWELTPEGRDHLTQLG